MDITGFIQDLQQQRLVMDYMCITTVAVFIYDHILTLPLEITMIWFSRWTYTKVLFLTVRYVAFAFVSLLLYNQLFFDIPAEGCRITSPSAIWLSMLGVFLSEVILAIRTYAVWDRNRVVGVGLAAMTLAHLVVQCVVLNKFIHSIQYEPPPYPGFRGCFAIYSDKTLWVNYLALTVVEALVLVLVVISAYRSCILTYVFLLCISSANVAVMTTLPARKVSLLTYLQDILYPILTIRIVLNIRKVGSQIFRETELHTGYDSDSIAFATPLQHDSCVYDIPG